jgi:hypothetical protein
MVIDYPSAIDVVYGVASTALQALTPALAEIRYPGSDDSTTPNAATYWARVSDQMVIERQQSLSAYVGAPGGRRYQCIGLVFVQLFCPKTDAAAAENGRMMATLITNAFRKTVPDGSLWFRNQQQKAVNYNTASLQFNVVATFEFYTTV